MRLGCRVRQIAADTDCVVIDGERFAAAILATAPQHVASLCGRPATDYAFEPICDDLPAIQRQHHPSLPAPPSAGPPRAVVVDRGNGLLACVVSGHGDLGGAARHELAATLAGRLDLGEAAAGTR